MWEDIVKFITNAGWQIVEFLAVLAAGIIIIRLVIMLLRRAFIKSPMSKTLSNFLLQIIKFLLYLVLVFLLAQVASIPMTPLIAALSSVALAVALALKDSLANLANGVILMGTKPFAEGDFVEVAGVSGTVKAVHMLSTEITTSDNKRITLPNGQINSSAVINYSAKPTRRVEWKFSVNYDADIDTVKSVILGELENHDKVLTRPDPSARLSEMADSAIVFTVRAWVNNSDYWDVFFDIQESVFKAFKNAGIEIPFNQLDVNIKNSEAIAEDKSSKAKAAANEKFIEQNAKRGKEGDK